MKVRLTLKAYRSPSFGVFDANETIMIELRGDRCGNDPAKMVDALQSFNAEIEAIGQLVKSRGGQVEKR